MYLLDSDICIELMRGNLPIAFKLMSNSDPQLFGIPCIVEAELRTGALKSDHPKKNLLMLERFLSPFQLVPFDSKCAVAYAKVRSQLESEGNKIGPNDTLIAATTIANNAVLVTHNVREFKRVSSLELEDWAEERFAL